MPDERKCPVSGYTGLCFQTLSCAQACHFPERLWDQIEQLRLAAANATDKARQLEDEAARLRLDIARLRWIINELWGSLCVRQTHDGVRKLWWAYREETLMLQFGPAKTKLEAIEMLLAAEAKEKDDA